MGGRIARSPSPDPGRWGPPGVRRGVARRHIGRRRPGRGRSGRRGGADRGRVVVPPGEAVSWPPVVVACPWGNRRLIGHQAAEVAMSGSVIVAGARTPIGKLSGALGGFAATELGGFAIAAALERAGVAAGPGRLRLHGPGHPGRSRADHRPPGGRQGRHPDERGRHHRQQGLPVRPQRHLPGRPADQRRRGRHRGRRRHGVDDPGPLPPARRPRRLPDRRRQARRLDDVRRPVLRLRPVRHGPRHRALQRGRRSLPRAPGRLQRPLPRAGRRRHQGRQVRRGDRPGRGAPAQGRPPGGRHRRRRPARDHGRVAGQAAPGLRQGRHHHRRQRQPDLRRRRRRDRDVQGQGRGARASPRSASWSATGRWPARARRSSTSPPTPPRWHWPRPA